MKLLFVCTGNTCRSPMAEGILNHLAGENNLDIRAQSAGIFAMAGSGAAENAIKAMEKRGIDISGHRARLASRELLERADLVLTMSQGHRENLVAVYPHIGDRVFTLNNYALNLDRDVEDPFGLGIEYYEKARDEIYRAIEEIIKREANL